MKKGAWKYFRPGDDYGDFMAFIDEHIGSLVEPNTDITDPADETWTLKRESE